MDYEKKYKEALEKARQLCAYPTTKPFISDLQDLFPELAESEDEKVRKAIIHFISHTLTVPKGIIGKETMLAWIEKQSEHANFRNKIQVGDKVTRNEAGVLVNLSQLNRVAKKNEKQGEQKPADSYCQENCKGYQETGKCFADGECKAKREAEQKTNKISMWSEEDERMFNSYCAAVAAADYYTLDDKQEIENWLKSLRPQNRWKPSELQLGCLSDAIEHYNSLGYPASKLKELLDDLKKLKECV